MQHDMAKPFVINKSPYSIGTTQPSAFTFTPPSIGTIGMANSTPATYAGGTLRSIQNLSKPFTPAPGQSLGNFAMETLKSVPSSVRSTGQGITGGANALLTGIAKGSVRNTIPLATNLFGRDPFTPSGSTQERFYETSNPLTLTRAGREFNPLVDPDAPTTSRFGQIAYPALGLFAGASDMFGGGAVRSLSQASKTLRGINTVEEAFPIIRKFGIAEKEAYRIAPIIAHSNSVKEIEDTLNAARNVGRRTVPRRMDELPEEARGFSRTREEEQLDLSAPPRRPSQLQEFQKNHQEFGEIVPQPSLKSSYARTIPDAEVAVNKVIRALGEVKPLLREQEAAFRVERSRRVARVASTGSRVGGEQGYFAQLGQLKGELPRAQFQSIRDQIKQPDIDALFNQIEKSDILTVFDKVSAKGGLAKLLGSEGVTLPTRSELKLLSEVFPPEFIKVIRSNRPRWQKILEATEDALNIPRALMATLDFSAPLRQGIFLTSRPKQFGPAFASMFKYAFNPKAYEGLIKEIQARPTYPLMREAKLAITSTARSLDEREETFMSTFAERIPGFGKLVKGSERAYVGFLNKLRADTFDDLLRSAQELGVYQERPGMIDDIAKFINSATGRGDIKVFTKAATILNSLFFSPRLIWSRVNLLNPQYYASLDPFVRRQALKSLIIFGSTATTIATLSNLGGADVEIDPRSSDFGKIKIGNTRYDPYGGFQQYIRFAAQFVSGTMISSTTGREITLGEGYKPLTRKDILYRFFENKEAPVVSFITSLMTGQDALGQPINIPSEVIGRLIPLGVQDMYNLYQEWGAMGPLLGIPGIFGVGSQTYGGQELREGVDELGLPTTELRGIEELSDTLARALGFDSPPLKGTSGSSVEAYVDHLYKLPKEEAASIFDRINAENPDLAKKIVDEIEDRQLGITTEEKGIRAKGVSDGTRAKAVMEKLNDLESKEEKAALWEDYVTKKIITDTVAEQLLMLLERQKQGSSGLTDVVATLTGAKTANAEEGYNPAVSKVGIKDVIKEIPGTITKFMQSLAPKTVGEARKSGGIPIGISISEWNKLPNDAAVPKGVRFVSADVGSLERTSATKIAPKVFEGFSDLSTKLLEKLKGKSTVSKQFISDLTNSPDIKQTEKDVIRGALTDESDKVNVPDFAEKVRAELLPLDVSDKNTASMPHMYGKYETVVLPDELRGPVANYTERVYESPVKTSAGDVHFGSLGKDGYFGHTRVEDLPDGKTSRVIEIQSDLFQKGRLEGERLIDPSAYRLSGTPEEVRAQSKALRENSPQKARDAELAKLEPYKNNAAHFRMIREEVKQAAKNGKTKLQFPTGETAMKIEGLGARPGRWNIQEGDAPLGSGRGLDPSNMEVGQRIYGDQGEWIITDVLGDGKFKAVIKPDVYGLRRMNPKKYEGRIDAEIEAEMIENAKTKNLEETFDISGKVDTENPIYKFYEKDVGKYLKNNYDAKLITDPQGVSWWEVDVKPEAAKKAVLAFGKINIKSLIGGAGITAGAAAMNAVDRSLGTTTIERKPAEAQTTKQRKEKPESVNEPSNSLAPVIRSVERARGAKSGILETILMMESSMAYDDSSQNPKIGRYAWLAGLTNSAKEDLEKAGISVDYNTREGALNAALDYWNLLKKRYPDESDEEIYFKHYYGGSKTTKSRRALFNEALRYFSRD